MVAGRRSGLGLGACWRRPVLDDAGTTRYCALAIAGAKVPEEADAVEVPD